MSRIDIRQQRATATIPLGIPGKGGDICYGAGSVWTTLLNVPLTRLDANTNTVVRQWVGPGGDSLRFGHQSIWLTDLRRGRLLRIPLKEVEQ